MAANNIRVVQNAGLTAVPVLRWLRDDRDTSSEVVARVGEPLKVNTTSGQFSVRLVDADLTIGTDQTFLGIAADDSTETASADGFVDCIMPLPGIVYEIAALTATAADTDSEIDALRGEYDVIDLTSTVYTLDTAAGSGANNAFLIIGGDSSRSVLWIMVRSDSTVFGRAQV